MSEHKQTKPAGAVVTSDSVQGKRHLPKNLRIIVSGLIVLVLLIVAGALFYHYVYKATPKPVASNTSIKGKDALLLANKQAIKKAQAEIKNASTSSQKVTGYNDLGGAYLDTNQGASAVTAYQNAINLSNSDSLDKVVSLEGLGYAYSLNGQNDKAISDFQDVVKLLQQSSSGSGLNLTTAISNYQTMIQRLQAGESI